MEAIRLLKAINHKGISWIAAAHLSEKNNDENLVRQLIAEATNKEMEVIKVIDQKDGLNWLNV